MEEKRCIFYIINFCTFLLGLTRFDILITHYTQEESDKNSWVVSSHDRYYINVWPQGGTEVYLVSRIMRDGETKRQIPVTS